MEQQPSPFDNSTPTAARLCQARLTAACQERGGRLEAGRRSNARLCRDCARRRTLDRSARWKRAFRCSTAPGEGWRVYRDKYSPYVSDEHRRECEREYQQRRRARQKLFAGA